MKLDIFVSVFLGLSLFSLIRSLRILEENMVMDKQIQKFGTDMFLLQSLFSLVSAIFPHNFLLLCLIFIFLQSNNLFNIFIVFFWFTTFLQFFTISPSFFRYLCDPIVELSSNGQSVRLQGLYRSHQGVTNRVVARIRRYSQSPSDVKVISQKRIERNSSFSDSAIVHSHVNFSYSDIPSPVVGSFEPPELVIPSNNPG